MFSNLKISYKVGAINVELTSDIDYYGQNFPDDIAELFARVMEDSNVNTDMVILNLIEKFGYNTPENLVK